jgi:hypothetical protein
MDHLPVVELLLKAGVDPNAADKVFAIRAFLCVHVAWD